MQSAVNILDATIYDNITVTILVGYNDFNFGQIQNLGTSSVGGDWYGSNISYASLRAAMAGHETSSLDQTVVNSLPDAASVEGVSTLYVPSAVEKALGMIAPTSTTIDGEIGIGSGIPTSLLVGEALHEITHAMGREPGAGTFDLSRYTSAGHHLFGRAIPAPAAYFSVDGGNTKLADFGQNSDTSDFLNSGVQGGSDPFDEYYGWGTIQNLTAVDKQALDAIGFDVSPTTVTSVVTSGVTDVAYVGDTLIVIVAFSRALTVLGVGTPTLGFNNGGTARYNAAATAALGDPTKLVFSYAVTAVEPPVTALVIIGGSQNGTYIIDSAGQAPDFSGVTTRFPAIQVATAPTMLTSVAAAAASSDAHVGDTVTLTLVFNRGVAVSGNGTPSLALNDGGTALYNAAATAALGDPTKLVFSYAVAATDTPVNALAIIGGSENGAYIADAAGQGPNFSGLLTSFPTIQIGTLPTVVTSVVASPGSGVAHFGDTVTLTLSFNQGVTVSGGTPTLTLNDGGNAVYNATATVALADPSKLVFSYTVAGADQSVNALALTGGSLNGASIVDANGNAPNFAAIYAASFASLSTLVGIDLGSVAYGAQTSLAYAPNPTNTGGTLTVTDTVHSAQVALLGQYAAADFHLGSDFHGGTVVSDPSLTGAAQTAFLASAHT